jgi:hypothetical protein
MSMMVLKLHLSGCCCIPLRHMPTSTECFCLVKWSSCVPTFVWSRGRSRCCGAWSLYNFGALFKGWGEIMNTNLGKVSIYLEWEKKSQVTNKKHWQISQTSQNPKKNNITYLLINCLTHLCNTFLPTFFGSILIDHLFIWRKFCNVIFCRENGEIIQSFV